MKKGITYSIIGLFFILQNVSGIDTAQLKKEVEAYLKGKKFNFTKEYIIKIGTLAPEHTPWVEIIGTYIIPTIMDATKGKVKVRLYSGGVMGDDPDIIRKMKLGQLQGCGCTATGMHILAPELAVFSLPLLFSSYDEVQYVVEKLRDDLDAIFAKKNLLLFTFIHTGFLYLFSKNKIHTLADMQTQKVLTWFGEVEQKTLEALGVHPIPLPVPEVVNGLRTGLINAHFSPPVWSLASQAYLSTHYFLTPPFFYAPACIVIDVNSIKDIPKDAIQLTKDVMRIVEKYWAKAVVEYEKKCIDAFTQMGLTPVEVNPADLKKIKEKVEEVWFSLAGKLYPQTLLEKILRFKDEYRMKIQLQSP